MSINTTVVARHHIMAYETHSKKLLPLFDAYYTILTDTFFGLVIWFIIYISLTNIIKCYMQLYYLFTWHINILFPLKKQLYYTVPYSNRSNLHNVCTVYNRTNYYM